MNASEESVILSQAASIIEHANRAKRDAEVALCVRCVTVFEFYNPNTNWMKRSEMKFVGY